MGSFDEVSFLIFLLIFKCTPGSVGSFEEVYVLICLLIFKCEPGSLRGFGFDFLINFKMRTGFGGFV